MSGFDYRTGSEIEILRHAELLEGMRVGEIPTGRLTAREARHGKGEVGLAIESFFGIPPNNIAGADFPAAAIELKVVPVRDTTRGIRVKERTFVSMIDYMTLVDERWLTASVRKKLHILFVFYEHIRAQPKGKYPIHSVLLWKPEGEVEDQIRADWTFVRDKVRRGAAHELSETDGRILGPSTKSADSTVLRAQPFSEIRAKPRAFALKPSFTFSLYVEPSKRDLQEEELVESVTSARFRQRFSRFVGMSIDGAAMALGRRPGRGKGYAGVVVREAARASTPIANDDFDLIGPTVRMTRVDYENYPYEAMSFPAFRHLDLVEEIWEDSELLSLVEHMLIVPTYGREKKTHAGDCIIGSPVDWRPTPQQLAVIEAEWTDFRDRIARGEAARLPSAAKTRALHIRPHARNKDDVDPVPGGGWGPKKSFWLNRRFVQSLLSVAGAQPPQD